MALDFQLLLFTTNVDLIHAATRSGIDGIIVDWEHLRKKTRQRGADTQINHDTLADLRRVRRHTDSLVLCRLNSYGPETPREVAQALDAGADELLLPMVRGADEVQRTLDLIAGRAGLGILIETQEAVARAEALCRLPLSRVYVGLNDLSIERGTPNIFTAVRDGTVAQVREACPLPFGFGGLTLPDRGFPIPCPLLMGEMMRLNGDFTFLRRSFLADTQGRDLQVAVARIRAALQAMTRRTPAQVNADRLALAAAIERWRGKHA